MNDSWMETGGHGGQSAEGTKLFELIQGAFSPLSCWSPTAPQSPPTKEDVLETAVHHAVAQFLFGLFDGSVDEEHSSAALMGFFGGCVNIYNLLSLLSGGEQTKVLWNVQKTKSDGTFQSEALTGGDFGIVFPTEEKDSYRLAFFQAKKEKRQSISRLDIGQISPSNYTQKLTDRKVAEAIESNLTAKAHKEKNPGSKVKLLDEEKEKTTQGDDEDNRLIKWFKSGEIEGDAKFHQILKLARTQSRGWKYDEAKPSWVHYVMWPVSKMNRTKNGDEEEAPPEFLAGFPLTASLDSVRKHVGEIARSDVGLNGISDFKNPRVIWETNEPQLSTKEVLCCPSFLSVIQEGIRGIAGRWLTVSSTQASELIGKFSPVGAEWTVMSDKDGGLIESLRKYGLVVSSTNADVAQLAAKLKNQLKFTPGASPT